MKVLLDVSSVNMPLSGIGRYALELGLHLPRQDGVESVSYLRDGEVSSELHIPDASGSKKQGFMRRRIRSIVPYDLVLAPYRRMKASKLGKSLQEYNDCVFHSPNFSMPPVSGPAVVTLHDLSVFHFPQFHPRDRVNYLKDQVHYSVEHADALVTDSDFVRSELLELFRVDPRKVHVVPLGVSESFRPRSAAELAKTLSGYGLEYGRYILSVGTIEPRKNLPALLHAYRGMDDALREQYTLVIAGAYGWKGDDTMREIRRLASTGDVLYLDFVSEEQLPELYAGAAAFCYFSFYEGFGLPVLEALASGVPVACSDIPVLRELSAGCALQASPHDIPGIIRAVEKALTDEAWRASAARKGLLHSAGYRWENTARALAQVFANLEVSE